MKTSPASLSAHDGQKLCRAAAQDAVWFHRLCVLVCVQGKKKTTLFMLIKKNNLQAYLLERREKKLNFC